MEYLSGFFAITPTLLLVIIWSLKHPSVKNFLLIAFVLRVTWLVLNSYIPIFSIDSSDQAFFEYRAIFYSNEYGLSVIKEFYKHDSLLVSKIISIFYTLFGESEMIARCLSIGVSTASVYLVYSLSLMLWDHNAAKKAAWLMATFPTIILYSSSILREPYIIFILLISLINSVRFIREETIKSFLYTLISFFILSYFHGAMTIGLFILLFFLTLRHTKKFFKDLKNFKLNVRTVLFLVLGLIPLIVFLIYNYQLPYIGGIKTIFNFDLLIDIFNGKRNSFGNTTYLSSLPVNNLYEFIQKLTLKLFYFTYGPFFWNINTTYHILGLIDGMIYFVLTIYILKNWANIWKNPITRFFLTLLLIYIFIYGFAVDNFGAAIRHRLKFLVIFIVLAAPKINRIIIFKKK